MSECGGCGGCGSRRLRKTGEKIRDIAEILPGVRAATTRHTIHVYECRQCGKEGMELETGLPGSCNLGTDARVCIADNFACRMPHRMSADRMGRDGLPVSTGTVNNVLARMGRNLGVPVRDVVLALQCAGVPHIDEISFKPNGKAVWVWIFLDLLTGKALFVIRTSRGRDVLEDVLPGFGGVIVCDGWKP